jgi:sulfur carrier protein
MSIIFGYTASEVHRDRPTMKVVLRNPRREVQVAGNRRVKDILRELDIIPETVLVIRGDDLVTGDQVVGDGDTIELRPVMSGGAP